MRKILSLVIVLTLVLAIPLLAQEEKPAEAAKAAAGEKAAEMSDAAMPGPPPALKNAWLASMVGNWEGTSKGSMGESKDVVSMKMGLDNQFLLMEVNSESPAFKMKGMGAVTVNQAGELVGFWIDNMRAMATGKGKVEGNVETMVWTMEGMGTYTRTVEKVDDDHLKISGKMEMPDGQVMEESGELMRVKMTDKS